MVFFPDTPPRWSLSLVWHTAAAAGEKEEEEEGW